MLGSSTYLLGRASTPGAPETRQFLTRNGVPFQWVDVDSDPLVELLRGRAELEGRRYPLALFADGSILEGPERFMLTRYVSHTPAGTILLRCLQRTNGPTPKPPDSSSNSLNAWGYRLDRRGTAVRRRRRRCRPRWTHHRSLLCIGRSQHNRGGSDRAWRSGWHKRSDRKLSRLPTRDQWSRTRGEHPRPGIPSRGGDPGGSRAHHIAARPIDGTFRVELTCGSATRGPNRCRRHRRGLPAT